MEGVEGHGLTPSGIKLTLLMHGSNIVDPEYAQ